MLYCACSHSCKYHMVQRCIIPPCALMQHCLMQKYIEINVAIEMYHSGVCVIKVIKYDTNYSKIDLVCLTSPFL